MSTPKPTDGRIALARDIENRQVIWYWWRTPRALNRRPFLRVTAKVRELVDADPPLARIRDKEPHEQYTLVELTEAGRQWAGLPEREVSDVS